MRQHYLKEEAAVGIRLGATWKAAFGATRSVLASTTSDMRINIVEGISPDDAVLLNPEVGVWCGRCTYVNTWIQGVKTFVEVSTTRSRHHELMN